MAFLNKILGKFIGSKADKDMTEIAPLLELIKKEYERIKLLSNDELRAETVRIKELIQERIKPEQDRINELNELADTVDIQEIEKLEEKINDKLEEVLNEILPVAFSIVKSTASLFKENERVIVKASDFDRDLAATRASILICLLY